MDLARTEYFAGMNLDEEYYDFINRIFPNLYSSIETMSNWGTPNQAFNNIKNKYQNNIVYSDIRIQNIITRAIEIIEGGVHPERRVLLKSDIQTYILFPQYSNINFPDSEIFFEFLYELSNIF